MRTSFLQRLGRRHRQTAWPMFVAVVIVVIATNAQGDDEVLLGTERWREQSYGVSFRPPLGARLISRTGDEAAVRVYGTGGYTIQLYIKKSAQSLAVRDLIPKAIHQLGGAYPSAAILEQRWIEPSGRPGAVIYFRIPDTKRGPWVMSQAFMQIDPQTFVMLQLQVDEDKFTTVRPVYDAVIQSLEAQNPKELDQLRAQQIARGQSWRQAISTEQLRKAIEPQRWMRIVSNDQDIGYIHIKQKKAAAIGQPGIRVDIRSRIYLDQNVYDSISNFFLADDVAHEIWSIRTTVRPRAANRKSDVDRNQTQSWSETGVRNNDKITVSIERPSGIEKHQWQKPPEGYLSQVEVHMLEQLMGHEESQTMGFYAYYPTAQKIVYRTTRLESVQDGSFTIHTRPSPEHDGHTSHYGTDGKLIKQTLPGGRLIVPTTRQQLAIKWNFR